MNKITGECDEPFKESQLFKSSDREQMELVQQLQIQFYNISRIMDCISCDKCRLNGKVQTLGLATALKVLLLPESERKQAIANLHQSEVISLV
jgi:hypothetical protein